MAYLIPLQKDIKNTKDIFKAGIKAGRRRYKVYLACSLLLNLALCGIIYYLVYYV